MKSRLFYLVLSFFLFYLGYKAATYTNVPEVIKRSKILLGTVVEIQVRTKNTEQAEKSIIEAFNEINRIDKLLSVYDTAGELYTMNKSRTAVYKSRGDIREVFELSDSLWRLTGGAFDASLGNVTDLWGFNLTPEFPGEGRIKSALLHSGWEKVKYENGFLTKNKCKINFGAIAKGYAVDVAVNLLKKNNMHDALVNAGGEIRSTGGEWNIGIQDPSSRNRIIHVLDLKDMSVATSGDYEQYFEYKGKKYHHILDPSTGYPGNKCRSVTVISKKNDFADGLATGIFIMGPRDGIALAERLTDIEVMIIDANDKLWYSSGFNNYIKR